MTSVINHRKSVVNCAENRVLEVLEDLRLDLKFVRKPQQSSVLLKSDKSPAYHLDLDHQPHRGFHRVRSSECFIVHVNTFFTSQQQTVAKPWEA